MKRLFHAIQTLTISVFFQPCMWGLCMWGLCLLKPDGQAGFGFRLGPLVLGVFWDPAEGIA